MSDTDGKKPLGLGGGARGPGQVKQSFSHGRTKSVAVEVKRKRVVVPTKPGAPGAGAAAGTNPHLGDPSKRPAGISDAEMEARLTAWRANPPPPVATRGYAKLYIDHVLQADKGCDLDFLVGASGSVVTRESH